MAPKNDALLAADQTALPSSPGNDFAHVKRVGVIGAGVSGLQMARALKAQGIEVVVFDKAPKCGGLWRENYSSYGVQVPRQLCESLLG
jgi:cation diffusion facilitator CzcD-associated flavoprotein CzcO